MKTSLIEINSYTRKLDVIVEWEQSLWIQNRDAAPVIIAQLDAGNMRIMGVADSIAPA